MRVGDAERDACLQDLNEHHALGRLSIDELDRRQRATLTAVTALDLAALTVDLPHDLTAGRPARRRAWSGVSSLFRSRLARRAAIWTGPPAAVVTASTFVVAADYRYDEQVFLASLATGAVGYLSHWVACRLKR